MSGVVTEEREKGTSTQGGKEQGEKERRPIVGAMATGFAWNHLWACFHGSARAGGGGDGDAIQARRCGGDDESPEPGAQIGSFFGECVGARAGTFCESVLNAETHRV